MFVISRGALIVRGSIPPAGARLEFPDAVGAQLIAEGMADPDTQTVTLAGVVEPLSPPPAPEEILPSEPRPVLPNEAVSVAPLETIEVTGDAPGTSAEPDLNSHATKRAPRKPRAAATKKKGTKK